MPKSSEPAVTREDVRKAFRQGPEGAIAPTLTEVLLQASFRRRLEQAERALKEREKEEG
jgi:hypothetical protein